ncbi:MAG: hypothetical protein KDE31_38445, partial [Caldilineaceae bacterium]|nr:hypothetical protein [Caldilineaceae bacterium]
LQDKIEEIDNIFVYNLLLSINNQFGRGKLPVGPKSTIHEYLHAFSDEESYADEEGDDDEYETLPQILIIDQFEEILTTNLGRWQQREDFFKQLSAAMMADPQLWVVLSMREDYVAAMEPYAHLLPGRMRARFYMQRMEERAALDAIIEPPKKLHPPCTFTEDAARILVQNLQRVRIFGAEEADQTHIGQFVEPVQLQVVCYQLWRNHLEDSDDPDPSDITVDDLVRLADGQDLSLFVNNALGQFYESVLEEVLAEPAAGHAALAESQLRDWFSNELITKDKTRRSVFRGPTTTAGIPNEIVRLLENRFLIRADTRFGAAGYELVHDRLVEPILRANDAWREAQLRANPIAHATYRAAQTWAAQGQPEDQLYRDRQLREALVHVDSKTIDDTTQAFLHTSEEAQMKRDSE